MHTFGNCLDVIVDADICSRGDMIFFFSSYPLGNCRAITAGSLISVMCSLGLTIRVSASSQYTSHNWFKAEEVAAFGGITSTFSLSCFGITYAIFFFLAILAMWLWEWRCWSVSWCCSLGSTNSYYMMKCCERLVIVVIASFPRVSWVICSHSLQIAKALTVQISRS